MLFKFVFFCGISSVLNQAIDYEGDFCLKEGVRGKCIALRNCKSALLDLQKRKRPQKCSFVGSDPIVCCTDDVTPLVPTVATTTTTRRPTTSTTEYNPPFYDYNMEASQECPPVGPSLTAPMDGRKAWDKCIEYQEKYVFPCRKSVALVGGMTRQKLCHHDTDQLIVGGVDAAKGEYPHMVLLGFGESLDSWVCAGSIISENYILTAGHCTFSRQYGGNVTYARIKQLNRSDKLVASGLYKIAEIIKHPQYNSPIKYHDIALLKTDRPMALDEYSVPACLDVGTGVEDAKAAASGWGLTSFNGQTSDRLQKVILSKFASAECSVAYRPSRLMKQGFQETTQLCYGDQDKSKDTCQGDSGGPLQVKNKRLSCMYTLIGVTSLGKGCGSVGVPGIYTRISHYTPWIESVVWPN